MKLKPLLLIAVSLLLCAPSFSAEKASVQLSAAGSSPREVEDTTAKAIVRDYGRAWQSLTTALSANRADALNVDFIGYAQDELRQRVAEQQKAGLHTRYVDRGHSLQAVLYSADGSAMQLRDTARLEVQVLDGSNVIHSDQITQNYLVVMTAAESRWKVRVLQALPPRQ